MNKKYLSLLANFSIDQKSNYTSDDTRFLPIVIDVLHDGENYNGSVFTKEVVDKCIDSIKNTAVLGFIDEDKCTKEKNFQGHEYIITKDENGTRRKYIGQAFGLIPESCNPRWVSKKASDGKTRNYLQVDALLWTKMEDAVEIMERDFETSQSMELEVDSVEGYEDEETGLFHFESFRFNGCCLISKEPAMIDSVAYINDNKEIEFTMNDFIRSVQSELNDRYTAFVKIANTKNKGGNETMPNSSNKKNNDFELSVMQQFKNVANIVRKHETCLDRWGDQIPRYCLVDIQDNEIIVTDRNDSYNYYGFKFSVNGDEPTIDFSSGCRKKIYYENYVDTPVSEPDGGFNFGKEIRDIEDKAFSMVEDSNRKAKDVMDRLTNIESEYEKVKSEYDEIKTKYEEYVQNEQARQEKELDSKKDAEFARFEECLGDNDDFISLKENKANMSVEDIITKCSILFTRVNLGNKNNFSKSNTSNITIGVMEDIDDNDGFIATKYGNIPVRR